MRVNILALYHECTAALVKQTLQLTQLRTELLAYLKATVVDTQPKINKVIYVLSSLKCSHSTRACGVHPLTVFAARGWCRCKSTT